MLQRVGNCTPHDAPLKDVVLVSKRRTASVSSTERHDGLKGMWRLALGRVAEIDPSSYAVVRSFPTGERTWGIGLSPDESRLCAASGLSGTLTIIDFVKNEVERTVQLGGRPWGAIAFRN